MSRFSFTISSFSYFDGNWYHVEWNAIAKKREEQRKKCVCHASPASYIPNFRTTNSRGIRSSAAGLRSRTLRAFGTSLQSESTHGKKRNGKSSEGSSVCHAFFFGACALFSPRRMYHGHASGLHKLYGVIISSPIYRATYVGSFPSSCQTVPPDINVTAGECSS